MTPLHRHQLALLTDAGWRGVLAGAWDSEARGCLAWWAQQRLPLVVTRQRPAGGDLAELDSGLGPGARLDLGLGLGLPAPGRWSRRRIALSVPLAGVSHFDAFPAASRLPRLLPRLQRAPWRALCEALGAIGVQARVYGSHGWQLITGLDHLRAGSDIDLCIAVDGPAQADAVAALLPHWPGEPRLDGELVFDGGSAVAWREWAAWRARRTPSVLVKQLRGVALAHTPFWRQAEAA